jgi:hypothetical protein
MEDTVDAAAEPGPLRFTRLTGAEEHIFLLFLFPLSSERRGRNFARFGFLCRLSSAIRRSIVGCGQRFCCIIVM